MLTLLCGSCIEERLSLGHHQRPRMLDGAAGSAVDAHEAAMVTDAGPIEGPVTIAVDPQQPRMLDGAVGSAVDAHETATWVPDAGPMARPVAIAVDPLLIEPPTPVAYAVATSPCDGSLYAATLECTLDDAAQPLWPLQRMSAKSSLLVETPLFPEVSWRATVQGQLAFEAGGLAFDAILIGEMDCLLGELELEIVDGRVVGIDPAAAEIADESTFIGQLAGELDPESGALQGDWWHAPVTGTPQCFGTWDAVRQD